MGHDTYMKETGVVRPGSVEQIMVRSAAFVKFCCLGFGKNFLGRSHDGASSGFKQPRRQQVLYGFLKINRSKVYFSYFQIKTRECVKDKAGQEVDFSGQKFSLF